MFVATLNYDLFQRADVMCAAESPDTKTSAQRFRRAGKSWSSIGNIDHQKKQKYFGIQKFQLTLN